jgi:uncharacterized protein with von Willebrand factor type A (vWA) domain
MPSPATSGHSQNATVPVDRIVGFAQLLRGHGIVVSPAEIVDSLRAIASMPWVLQSRNAFSATLASTLVKRAADLQAFRTLFALWFDAQEASKPVDHHLHANEQEAHVIGVDLLPRAGEAMDAGHAKHEHGKKIDLRRYFGEGIARPEHDHHAEGRLKVTWMGSELHYDQDASHPHNDFGHDGSFGLRRVSTSGRPGGLRPPSTVVIPRSIVLSGLRELIDSSGQDDPDEELWQWLDEQAGALQRGRMVDEADIWPAVDHMPVQPDLPASRWDELAAEDSARLQRGIHRLGAKLGGAPGHRRADRRGRLDARRTMRRASATGGVPFKPVFRKRQNDRPRLVVLCDASLSVRSAARFLLAVSQAAQRQTGHVRTFVFVRDVREVTLTFEQRSFDEAIRCIFSGKLIDTSEASDGGAAIAKLLSDHGDIFNAKTTLLILGDARNNGHDPNIAALAELKRRCRRVIWLTPEQRGAWRLAGCDLPRYEAFCDLIATVRTPAELERLVNEIVS